MGNYNVRERTPGSPELPLSHQQTLLDGGDDAEGRKLCGGMWCPEPTTRGEEWRDAGDSSVKTALSSTGALPCAKMHSTDYAYNLEDSFPGNSGTLYSFNSVLLQSIEKRQVISIVRKKHLHAQHVCTKTVPLMVFKKDST